MDFSARSTPAVRGARTRLPRSLETQGPKGTDGPRRATRTPTLAPGTSTPSEGTRLRARKSSKRPFAPRLRLRSRWHAGHVNGGFESGGAVDERHRRIRCDGRWRLPGAPSGRPAPPPRLTG